MFLQNDKSFVRSGFFFFMSITTPAPQQMSQVGSWSWVCAYYS